MNNSERFALFPFSHSHHFQLFQQCNTARFLPLTSTKALKYLLLCFILFHLQKKKITICKAAGATPFHIHRDHHVTLQPG